VWSAAGAGSSLQVSIYDTGLATGAQARVIFKEFHRLDQGARIARGHGLGPVIVERLARVPITASRWTPPQRRLALL